MNKKDRFNYYKHFVGISSWEIGSDSFSRPIIVNDGPLGLRKPVCNDFANQAGIMTSVCLLSPSALAASFDEEVCYKNGTLLAKDCLSKKVDVLLAPGINIKRNCLCGRNFEYFSEDPFLTGLLASQYILGIEDNGACACVKHYACNNQENYRLTNSSEISLRALNDIYLYPFRYVFKHANPKVVMTSYNKINGTYVNESHYLLQRKIREEYNYKGLIISDWTAVVDKAMTISAGLNVEMPPSKREFESIDKCYNDIFDDCDLIARKNEIDNALRVILNKEKKEIIYDFDQVHNEARLLARDSLVLVKNEDKYLPFNHKDKILVLGDFASNAHCVGGGSAWVKAYKKVSFIEALNNINVNFDYMNAYECDKYTLDEKDFLNRVNDYDKVIVFVGQYEHDESEGRDRNDISLRVEQKQLISFLNKHNIAYASVVITGSVLDISELKKYSKSIIISYLAGEGMYEAILDTVLGISNPSGRLPETWISSLDANPIYKSFKENDPFYSYYDDDIYVGYRYYNRFTDPFDLSNYLFGYGLSYSSFTYDDFNVWKDDKKICVSLKINNISNIDGKDVIQIYAYKNDSNIYRTGPELKAIKKVFVKGGEEVVTTIEIDIDELKVYDEYSDEKKLEKGTYKIYVGKSSFEFVYSTEVTLDGDILKETTQTDLSRKDRPTIVDFTFPVELVLNDEKFIKMMKEVHPDIDINKFFDEHKWMVMEPIKNLTYTNDLNLDYEIVNKYFPLNKK